MCGLGVSDGSDVNAGGGDFNVRRNTEFHAFLLLKGGGYRICPVSDVNAKHVLVSSQAFHGLP